MSSEEDDIREIQQKIGGDYTESVIAAVYRDKQKDKNKVIDFFRPNAATQQAEASINETVRFLRELMPIEGIPDKMYQECVEKAGGNLSDAVDMLTAESKKFFAREVAKENKISVQREAEQKEADFYALLEKQKKEAHERELQTRRLEEQHEEVNKKIEEIFAHIKKNETTVVPPIVPPMPKPIPSAVNSSAVNPHPDGSSPHSDLPMVVLHPSHYPNPGETPDYMKGRLPTDLCVILPTVSKNVISFTWSIKEGVELNPKDWIGLFIHDRQFSNKYENYVNLAGKREGSASFIAPTNGYFDLRYFQKNGREEKSRSLPFLVGPEMTVNATLQGRRKIVVSWNRTLESERNWLALFPISTYSNTQYIKHYYASSASRDGTITFDAPRQPGEYEVRYFLTDKHTASGYAYSGNSDPIVIPNEDSLVVTSTHPVVRVQWQTFSQEPNTHDWVGLYASSDPNAERLGWEYLCNGTMDSVGDHGVALINNCRILSVLAPEDKLPEGSDKWEVRLFNRAPNQPFLRAPFINPH